MNRIDVIQQILDKSKGKTYLEIGVRRGHTFLKIRAKNKLAVDPRFMISRRLRLSSYITNPTNFASRYFAMTSDEFFSQHAVLPGRLGLDVVFVDGLHTYDQSLRDVQNSLKYLNPGGAIVLHDCNPQSEVAAEPSQTSALMQGGDNWDGGWSGDVWKTIVHLRATRSDLTVFVLDCDSGLGVVTHGKQQARLPLQPEEIHALTYRDLNDERQQLLNLKAPDYLTQYFQSSLGVSHPD